MADSINLALLQALQGNQAADYKSSPFMGAGAAIQGANLYDPSKSTGNNLLVAALQGALGGGLQGFGKQSIDNEYGDISTRLATALDSPTALSNVSEDPQLKRYAPFVQALTADRNQQLQDQQTQQANDLQKIGAQNALQYKSQSQLAQEEYNRQNPQSLGVAGQVPPGQRTEALNQLALQEQNRANSNFVKSQFETAANIKSAATLMPYSTAANEMEGIRISLKTSLQAKLGREMNAKEQESLDAALPDWNDTKAQIALKQKRFEALSESIAKQTPLADVLTGGSASPSPTPRPIPKPLPGESLEQYKTRVRGG